MTDGMRTTAAENRVRVRPQSWRTARRKCDTQLHAIRDLMLSAAQRGAWMTLGEIAGLTEIGEASISAQLRHLRKARHGRHRVEKRRRTFFVSGLPRSDGTEGPEIGQVQPAPVATGEGRPRLAEEGHSEPPHPFRKTESVRHPTGVVWEYRVLPTAR